MTDIIATPGNNAGDHASRHSIVVDGARIFFREQGSGTPVILLHSTASSGGQWEEAINHLSRRHRVIAPDLPGYGRSEGRSVSKATGLAPYVRCVNTLIAHCGEPVHLVGHSFGGAVALKIVLEAGHTIRSLSLIEPAAFHLLKDGTAKGDALLREIRAVNAVVAASAASDDPRTGIAHFIDYWNGKGTWQRIDPPSRSSLVSKVGRILGDFEAIFAEQSSLHDCASIDCPVLAIVGMGTAAVTRPLSEAIARMIPASQLHMVCNAGHMLPVSHPHIVNPILSGHFQIIDARHASLKRAA